MLKATAKPNVNVNKGSSATQKHHDSSSAFLHQQPKSDHETKMYETTSLATRGMLNVPINHHLFWVVLGMVFSTSRSRKLIKYVVCILFEKFCVLIILEYPTNYLTHRIHVWYIC